MQPGVGVGVFIFNPQGQFVMGVRKGSLGAGITLLQSITSVC